MPERMLKTRRQPERALRRAASGDRGFSLIELMTVLAVSAILTALVAPQVMRIVRLSRMRSAAASFSGLIQQARSTAEQKNLTIPVFAGSVQSSTPGAFVACSSSSCPTGGNGTSYQSGDTAVQFPSGVTNGSAGSAPSGLSPGFTAETAGTTMYLSPRGVAVKASGTTYVLSNGFIFYLTDANSDWAAVAVSPLGRSQAWVWNGSNWN